MHSHDTYLPLMGATSHSPISKKTPAKDDMWLGSAKLDGMRGVWDGQNILSRSGRVLMISKAWNSVLPSGVALDGELYMGQGKFEECGLFRRKDTRDFRWKLASFQVFDCPTIATKSLEKRLVILKLVIQEIEKLWNQMIEDGEFATFSFLPDKCPIQLVEHVKLKSTEIDTFYAQTLDMGYEGIMLKDPSSPYLHREKTTYWLKKKPVCESEGVVVGYRAGRSRHLGRLGAFRIWPCIKGIPCQDKEFHLSGMNDKTRINYKTSHPIGTIVTYIYERPVGAEQKPRFPRYKGQRGFYHFPDQYTFTTELVIKEKPHVIGHAVVHHKGTHAVVQHKETHEVVRAAQKPKKPVRKSVKHLSEIAARLPQPSKPSKPIRKTPNMMLLPKVELAY